ncbi:hypothetical protein [Cupriavidus basilensis]|jgi:hypothetical protein|uniref:hypothetical protein n=1 Tax=Cupriavidus basilensis TaxID=68895 RepID=UPI0023E7EE37|nr:hypothetical protein [Cupriavidus basilensis]MDF3881087.1 hypothetical protein [Cupriavidus basilensis]
MMKLSALESLVKAMRAKAREMRMMDPNVEFWDADTAIRTPKGLLRNMEPMADAESTLEQHVVETHGSAAQPGDFAIPMRAC